jgi:hypothetical protein
VRWMKNLISMDHRRNELARCLGGIDQCVAKAEAMAADPYDAGERQSALEFLLSFRKLGGPWKQS